MKESRIDKKDDEKEAEELKQIYIHYIDQRKDILKNTQFKVKDVFGDVISRDNFSQEQITELNIFFSKNNVNININIQFTLFKRRKKKIWIINRVLLLIMNNFSI